MKIIKWIFIVVLFLIISGGLAWWFFFKSNPPIIQWPEQGGELSSLLQRGNLPKLKSKEIVKENVTQTARFTVVPEIHLSQTGLDCLYLDKTNIKKKFEEIILSGTVHGTLDEYDVSAIEIEANGTLEKRTYDYGKCYECPPGVDCRSDPCGEHTSECINPQTLQRINDDGIKYGVNWFAGRIIRPTDNIMINIDSVGTANIKDGAGNITKTYKYNMHLNTDYSGKVLADVFALAFKNEGMYLTREDIINSSIMIKVYGEKTQAEFCHDPLTNENRCFYKNIIIVEKIIDDKGENIVAQKTE